MKTYDLGAIAGFNKNENCPFKEGSDDAIEWWSGYNSAVLNNKELTREQALLMIKTLDPIMIKAISLVIETADVQGDWYWNGEDSVYEDDVQGTLNSLASEIRKLK